VDIVKFSDSLFVMSDLFNLFNVVIYSNSTILSDLNLTEDILISIKNCAALFLRVYTTFDIPVSQGLQLFQIKI